MRSTRKQTSCGRCTSLKGELRRFLACKQSALLFFSIMAAILMRKDEASPLERCVAALTTANRDVWAKNRRRFFVEATENRHFLEAIESAISVFVLDDDNYCGQGANIDAIDDKARAHYFRHMLAGNGRNRWADKPLHCNFDKNGAAGGTSEHSTFVRAKTSKNKHSSDGRFSVAMERNI